VHVKLYVPDIECDSCVNLISRKFRDLQGIENYKVHQDTININYDETLIKPENIINSIKHLGFRVSIHPFERKSFKERAKDFKENKHKYHIEWTGLGYALSILFILFVLEAFAYLGFLKNIPDFLSNYSIWLVYMNISVVTIGLAVWHIFAYRTKITCMVGMMLGMTVGMQTGMMIGSILGATNGIFVGAFTGMILGTIVGASCGKDCGIMGVMEGMMAGLMGGTMGPMITVMMISDQLHWFFPPYMLINVLIVGGLSYMLFEEAVEYKENVIKTPTDFMTFAAACILITFVLNYIMIYGPKNPLIGF